MNTFSRRCAKRRSYCRPLVLPRQLLPFKGRCRCLCASPPEVDASCAGRRCQPDVSIDAHRQLRTGSGNLLGRFPAVLAELEGHFGKTTSWTCEVDADLDLEGEGRFLTASCTNHAGTRAYKVYVPSSYDGQAIAADRHAAWLQTEPERLRRRYRHERDRRAKQLLRGLSRAGARRQWLELLELVQAR